MVLLSSRVFPLAFGRAVQYAVSMTIFSLFVHIYGIGVGGGNIEIKFFLLCILSELKFSQQQPEIILTVVLYRLSIIALLIASQGFSYGRYSIDLYDCHI